jgi:DNA polymerase V
LTDAFQPIPSKKIFALVDCNNFFASCERVADPSLKDKPLVVLSHVGGIAIARSNEAKALGIKMAQPYFQWQHLAKKNDVQLRTANFSLYSALSQKVMGSLDEFSPDIEVYSIDEAFLGLETIGGIKDLVAYGQKIRAGVLKATGLPVSVGMAPTKTLAKLANHKAKVSAALKGVCSLISQDDAAKAMQGTPVGEVWGVGRKTLELLTRKGIETAWDLREVDDKWVKRNMGVVGLRTVWELRGISCLALEDIPAPPQSVSISRTFEKETKDLDDLKEALSGYVARAAENMRAQGQVAGHINVFITTGPFKADYCAETASARIDPRTDYTPELIKTALGLLDDIYRPRLAYKRAGVVLGDLKMKEEVSLELFQDESRRKKSERVMQVVDRINAKADGAAVFFAGEQRGKLH